LKTTVRAMPMRLGALAGVAGPDVVLDKAGDVWPVKVARQQLECFDATEMASRWVIVRLAKDVGLEGLIVWNIDEAVPQE
jgi:hypothetical protein